MLESIFTVSKVFLTSVPKKRHTLKYAVALYANQEKIIASETPRARPESNNFSSIVFLGDTNQIRYFIYSLSCERKYYITQYVPVCTEIKSSKSSKYFFLPNIRYRHVSRTLVINNLNCSSY